MNVHTRVHVHIHKQKDVFGIVLTHCAPRFCSAAGNKSDLHLQRQVLFEDACTLAEHNGVLAALETSAMEAQNVEAAFVLMARELMARNGPSVAEEASQSPAPLRGSTRPLHASAPTHKKCGCRAN